MGLPPDLNTTLREALLRCGPFNNAEQLQALFVDERIAAWQDCVKEANNASARVALLIKELHNQSNPQGDNALVLFLQVLADTVPPGNRCRGELLALAEALQLEGTQTKIAVPEIGTVVTREKGWAFPSSIPTAVIFAFLAIAIIYISGYNPGTAYKLMLNYLNSSSLAFKPASPNEILVIIAPHHGSDEIYPDVRIERMLREELKRIPELSNVRIERYPEAINERDSAAILENIKATYKPAIIIWGWHDDLGVTTNVDTTEKANAFPSDYEPSLAEVLRLASDPDQFVLEITTELPNEVTHLTFFTISQIYAARRDYNEAISYLEMTIQTLPSDASDETRQLLSIHKGFLYLANEDFDQSAQIAEVLLSDREARTSMIAHSLSAVTHEVMAVYEYVESNDINMNIHIQMIGSIPTTVISADKQIPPEAYKSLKAYQTYNYMIAYFPNHSKIHIVYFGRARQHFAFGNLNAAFRDLDKAIMLDPSPESYFIRASYYLHIGETEKAQEDFATMRELDPNFSYVSR